MRRWHWPQYVLLALALGGCDAFTPFEPAVDDGGDPGPDPASTATITFRNAGSSAILTVYASPCEDTSWTGAQNVTIQPGSSHDRSVDAPGCYDLAAEFEGHADTRLSLQVEAGQSYEWSAR